MPKNRKIGILISYNRGTDLKQEIEKAKALELSSAQICIWDTSIYKDRAQAVKIKSIIVSEKFEISALWAGLSEPREWNFTAGPSTIGLVPAAYRNKRIDELVAASEFAEMIGLTDIITHVGFIPENPYDPDFIGTVAALRYVCKVMTKRGQNFLFETGQETPITMLRTIEAIGTDNLGVNFDTANLILYGKGNSLDAIDVFGKYVKNTHIKDGFYPTNGMKLGTECVAGGGKANIAEVVKKLESIGYCGAYTIEREINGEQQIKDIIIARDLLRSTLN